MFEKATRDKIRFNTPKGLVTVEDLWDLPLTSETKVSLNSIGKALIRQIKDSGEEDLVDETPENTKLTSKLDIIKYIIKTRKEENAAKTNEKVIATQREKLQTIIASKKDAEMGEKSIEDLEKELAELG